MTRIGLRELRQHASAYLDQVETGATIEVTRRGQLVALIVPPGLGRTERERLIAEGRLIPGTGRLRLPERVRVATTTETVLGDLRADR